MVSFKLLFLICFFPITLLCKAQNGKIISSETNKGIAFASIGIIGKDVGTVSDESGNFDLIINHDYDDDTIRFSMIGYYPKTIAVKDFTTKADCIVLLTPKTYQLNEVLVSFHKSKTIRLGVPARTDILNVGFAYNNLGTELGINVNLDKPVRILDCNLNIAVCSFDSVIYRLNFYEQDTSGIYQNNLHNPIYIKFTKDQAKEVVTCDLSKYSIVVKGNVLITLELIKDMGEGRLVFGSNPDLSMTFFRKTKEGSWKNCPGAVGLYLNGLQSK